MNQFRESAFLAWRDWKYEHLISLCAILALASMLSPILVLQGLKNGVIDGMRKRLLEDPAILIITPKSDAGKFSTQFIEELAKLPGARFAIGRTRDTSTDINVFNPSANARATIAFEPAAEGEPVLMHYNLAAPLNNEEPEIILSTSAAKALGAKEGNVVDARIGRRTPQGRLESLTIKMRVSGVLPVEAGDRRIAFAPLKFLEQMENYRDYIAVPERNLEGRDAGERRDYASFRLYAASLDAVETLTDELESRKIAVFTRAREVKSIRLLERSINQVIAIVSIAIGAGFMAFTISSVQGAVTRKKRMLGMLRLLGFKRLPLMLYPQTQTMLTAVSGFFLSLLIYFCVSLGIKGAFAGQGVATYLYPLDIIISFLAVVVLSAISCAGASRKAADVEPSIVIREI